MAKISFTVPHALSKAEAKKRILRLLTQAKKEHGDLVTDLEESWKGDTGTFSFNARGYAIRGTITVGEDAIELDGEVPLAISFFKGKIEKLVRKEAEELLR
ncbi:MAG: polyhydroxyalkanoic acid system family protein [Patescibacteria group bacterium]